jgi:hypothetical protein
VPAWRAAIWGSSNILCQLAQPWNAIVAREPDWNTQCEWEPGKSALFAAHDWGRCPYLDTIEIQMGRAPSQQSLDFETGRADVIEAAETSRCESGGLGAMLTLVVGNPRVAPGLGEAIPRPRHHSMQELRAKPDACRILRPDEPQQRRKRPHFGPLSSSGLCDPKFQSSAAEEGRVFLGVFGPLVG